MFTVAVLIVATGAEASAQEARLVVGSGNNSGGAWTQARQARSPKQGLNAQWVAGYLSGANMEETGPEALRGIDFEGMVAWIDNYCQANPLEFVATAAFSLLKTLRARALQDRR
jgi:hypothetical protein